MGDLIAKCVRAPSEEFDRTPATPRVQRVPDVQEIVVFTRRPHLLVAVAVIGTLLVACSSGGRSAAPRTRPTSTTTTTTRPGADSVLTIGQLAPLTGPIAIISNSFTVPVKLAVDEINISGGVNGKPVGLVVADDGSESATARAAVTSLIDTSRADAIVGPSTSQVALDLVTRPPDHRAVICSGSNSYGPISDAARRDGFYFRTAPPDRLQARAIAKLLIADGRTRPAVIAARDDYGLPFGTEIVRSLVAGRVSGAALISLRAGDAGASRAGADALAHQPDAIVLIGFPDGMAPVLRALSAQGKGPTQIPTYGSDGLQNAELGTRVDPANPAVVATLKGTTPAGAPAGIDHPFNTRLFAAGVEPFFSASTYDCVVLIGLAAVAARSDEPQAIRDRFAKNLSGKTICGTFLECADALKRGKTIHYHGASSTFDRWSGFEPGTGVFDVWTLGLDARPALAPAAQQLRVP